MILLLVEMDTLEDQDAEKVLFPAEEDLMVVMVMMVESLLDMARVKMLQTTNLTTGF